MGRIIGGILGAVVFLFAMSVVFGSWYTIDQGERGVVLRNGAFSAVAEPGLHFKIPWIDDVAYFSVQTQKRTYGPEGLASYSRDQQPADLVLTVNYRLMPPEVAGIYERFGSRDNAAIRLIDPQVFEETKNVFGRFNAVTAVQDRVRLNQEIEDAVREGLQGEPGIFVESVQIENIDFSDAYEDSVEARMLAEVEVQKIRQNAERERVQAEIVVIQATAEADKVKLQGEAQGERARLIGEGEADAIRAKGKALRDNPDLIDLVQAERWDGVLPRSMPPNGTVPFLNVGPAGQLGGTEEAPQMQPQQQ